jgi:hypothetical protein
MHPQCDDYWLTMHRIAKLYEQCGFDHRRISRWLINAYWRGEFKPRSSTSHPMIPRGAALAAFRDYDHPEILFLLNDIPMERRDDGSIRDALCPSIVLSERTEEWTDQHCEPAYRVLAHVDHNGVALDCVAGLMCQSVGGYELFAICTKLGVEPPPFWRRFWPRRKGDAHKLAQLVNWFHSKIEADERVTRGQLRDQAATFSIKAKTVVDKIWDEFAPDGWKSPGRPKGASNRH